MNRSLVAALSKLRSAYPESVSGSGFTENQRKELANFERRTCAIQCKRKGRGLTCYIVDWNVVDTHLANYMPGVDAIGDIPARATNLALNRNSKAGKSTHDKAYLLLKTVGSPVWCKDGNVITDLQRMTQAFGVCSLEIGGSSNKNLITSNPIWLVENQALFDRLDWLPSSEPATVIWYRGQMDNKLIDWLGNTERTPKVYLFADYDGVGLSNYYRIRENLQDRVEFWLMPQWKRLLKTYGSDEVWKSTRDDFEKFINNSCYWLADFPTLRELVTEMQKNGLALEQEAVWLVSNSKA